MRFTFIALIIAVLVAFAAASTANLSVQPQIVLSGNTALQATRGFIKDSGERGIESCWYVTLSGSSYLLDNVTLSLSSPGTVTRVEKSGPFFEVAGETGFATNFPPTVGSGMLFCVETLNGTQFSGSNVCADFEALMYFNNITESRTGSGCRVVETVCRDDVDNDGDALVDCDDPDCLMTDYCLEQKSVSGAFKWIPIGLAIGGGVVILLIICAATGVGAAAIALLRGQRKLTTVRR